MSRRPITKQSRLIYKMQEMRKAPAMLCTQMLSAVQKFDLRIPETSVSVLHLAESSTKQNSHDDGHL